MIKYEYSLNKWCFMNCIEKMYKEIEEILIKEKLEAQRMQTPIREIKHGFSSFEEEEKTANTVKVDYLSNIVLDEAQIQKKYLDSSKAIKFIEFIFKKYSIIISNENGEDEFASEVLSKINNDGDLIEELKSLENDFVKNFDETDAVKEYFENPYNALFKDENGYYAVILNGRFSDVKRPQSYIPNQVKKHIKESLHEYSKDLGVHFSSDKERVSLLNSIKAEINKCDKQEYNEIEEVLETLLYKALEKKGLEKSAFIEYIENKGLKLVKQGNSYYRKKAYNKYAEYKKIEFRY